ncbi:hypothetical protein OG453_07550 [Streptomyces sp. NBC_01381]|uniref:hypothetical protein n=1 Tax=Streptomyces sp. NBC_01381 TaxID=2903845 RepID=UPI002257524B|nr:hypothetical protein [Streptomyces sp. NBC_01381]MCX4666524.1 hypothetical protein [Streptomyces sp. NBC_01381]
MGKLQNKKLIVSVGAVCAAALASGGWWIVSQKDSTSTWDRSLTYAEQTTIPVDGGRIEIAYQSVDKASSNIPNYGDRTYTPHISVTAYNDSDDAKDYTVTFKVLRGGEDVKPHSTSVTVKGVPPDSKTPAQYEITQKKRDSDVYDDEPGKSGADQEAYIGSPTGEDFTVEIQSVKAEKHYALSGKH